MSWFPSGDSDEINPDLATGYWRWVQVAFWGGAGFGILELMAGFGGTIARIAFYALGISLAGLIVYLPIFWASQIKRGEKGAPPVFVVVFYVFVWGAIVYGTFVHTSDRDCADFASRAEAQEFFRSEGGPSNDPHGLDGDDDGQACEHLP